VQLRDDDPLGAVDDERAGGRHERNLAHVDLLLLDFLDGRLDRFLVHDDQANPGTQGSAEGQAALLAFLDVERRMAEHEADELEARKLVVGHDREDRPERRLQPFLLALGGVGLSLQKLLVRLDLRGEQIGHVENDRALRETLANALLLGE